MRLPLLAWGSNQEQQQPSGPIPLLHINSAQDTSSDPFRNLRRFLPQVPPPQPYSYSTPPSFSQPTFQAPPSFPSASQFPSAPAQSQQRYHPPSYEQSGFPLLSVSGVPQPLQVDPMPVASGPFPLLRILPPGVSEHEQQRTRIEETRQRLLQKFHHQVLQDKENVDQAMMAQRLLRLEPQTGEQPVRELDQGWCWVHQHPFYLIGLKMSSKTSYMRFN